MQNSSNRLMSEFSRAHDILVSQWRLKVSTHRLVRIQRCSDPSMWYYPLVGRDVPIVQVDQDGLWAREPAGYLNIIKFEDVQP